MRSGSARALAYTAASPRIHFRARPDVLASLRDPSRANHYRIGRLPVLLRQQVRQSSLARVVRRTSYRSPMKALKSVESFGGIDADADNLLDQCFQDHEAYTEAMIHSRQFILGRKGSGKTAIYRKIVGTSRYDVFAAGHTFADYPWHHHKLQESVGVPAELRYVQSWRYLILMTIAKLLTNTNQSGYAETECPENLAKLRKFLVDGYGTASPDVGKLFSPDRKLKIRPTYKVPGVEGLGLNLERLPIQDLPKVVKEVNDKIAGTAIKCVNPEHDYFICFDELDRGFEPGSQDYLQMIIGLLLAAKLINDKAREDDKKLSVLVFLRDDIYNLLRFEDKNKITERLVSRIEWDSDRTKWTLRKLMESRFSQVLGKGKPVSWDAVFDETQEMSGRQSKYRHMLDRTFRRPRDIIKFCNEVLVSNHDGSGTPKFSNEDVVSARAAYSEYLVRELVDEVHKHLPEHDDYFDVISSVGKAQFTRSEWNLACASRDGHGKKLLIESGDILRQLFEFSIVGYQRTGGVKGGSEYVWRYLEDRARFDKSATSFRIHPGLIEALGLKKWAKH